MLKHHRVHAALERGDMTALEAQHRDRLTLCDAQEQRLLRACFRSAVEPTFSLYPPPSPCADGADACWCCALFFVRFKDGCEEAGLHHFHAGQVVLSGRAIVDLLQDGAGARSTPATAAASSMLPGGSDAQQGVPMEMDEGDKEPAHAAAAALPALAASVDAKRELQTAEVLSHLQRLVSAARIPLTSDPVGAVESYRDIPHSPLKRLENDLFLVLCESLQEWHCAHGRQYQPSYLYLDGKHLRTTRRILTYYPRVAAGILHVPNPFVWEEMRRTHAQLMRDFPRSAPVHDDAGAADAAGAAAAAGALPAPLHVAACNRPHLLLHNCSAEQWIGHHIRSTGPEAADAAAPHADHDMLDTLAALKQVAQADKQAAEAAVQVASITLNPVLQANAQQKLQTAHKSAQAAEAEQARRNLHAQATDASVTPAYRGTPLDGVWLDFCGTVSTRGFLEDPDKQPEAFQSRLFADRMQCVATLFKSRSLRHGSALALTFSLRDGKKSSLTILTGYVLTSVGFMAQLYGYDATPLQVIKSESNEPFFLFLVQMQQPPAPDTVTMPTIALKHMQAALTARRMKQEGPSAPGEHSAASPHASAAGMRSRAPRPLAAVTRVEFERALEEALHQAQAARGNAAHAAGAAASATAAAPWAPASGASAPRACSDGLSLSVSGLELSAGAPPPTLIDTLFSALKQLTWAAPNAQAMAVPRKLCKRLMAMRHCDPTNKADNRRAKQAAAVARTPTQAAAAAPMLLQAAMQEEMPQAEEQDDDEASSSDPLDKQLLEDEEKDLEEERRDEQEIIHAAAAAASAAAAGDDADLHGIPALQRWSTESQRWQTRV
jgi:hypothetical protein